MKNEDFITFEQAIEFRKLGFDWDCDKFYATQNYCIECDQVFVFLNDINKGDLISNPKYKEDENDGWIIDEDWSVPAPTLFQIHKWLRLVKGIDITIGHVYHELDTGNKVMYSLHIGDQSTFKTEFYRNYDTYYEAFTTGINNAIKILKNKIS